MNAKVIHLLGLIAGRALAEFDPYEFTRISTLSKSELDQRIRELLLEADESEESELYAEIGAFRNVSEVPQRNVFYRHLYEAAFSRAQYLALLHFGSGAKPSIAREVSGTQGSVTRRAPHYDEVLKLSVMALVRKRPEYSAAFYRHFAGIKVDAVLDASQPELPQCLVMVIPDLRSVEKKTAQLRSLVASLHTAVGLLVAGSHLNLRPYHSNQSKITFVVFDVTQNEFVGEEPNFENLHNDGELSL